MNEIAKEKLYSVEADKREERKRTPRLIQRVDKTITEGGEIFEVKRDYQLTPEQAEYNQIVVEMARAFIGTVEYYKAEHGGGHSHDEAVQRTLEMNESRRKWIEEGTKLEEISWSQIAAVGETNMKDAVQLWTSIKDAAIDELESGRRAAKVTGDNTGPFALAQFLAIRDAFADQWQPQGGIESALIDMLVISFSLFMYWSTIGHERALRTHDVQKDDLKKFESFGWKSPYQSSADAIDQANRLADGYSRQFSRVLRQLRDLRRYSPVVIQNNGGQVNLGAQQVNLQG